MIMGILSVIISRYIARLYEINMIAKNANNLHYYVESPGAEFSPVGFVTLEDAREYAILETGTLQHYRVQRPEDRIAKIFEKEGKHIETYVCGRPEAEYHSIKNEEERKVKPKSFQASVLARNELIVRNNFQYYVVRDGIAQGGNTLEAARKFASLFDARGMYRMNGQLNEKEIKIFERGGKLIETYRSGLTEAEYNAAKAKQETKEEKPVKAVTSFSWNSDKMR